MIEGGEEVSFFRNVRPLEFRSNSISNLQVSVDGWPVVIGAVGSRESAGIMQEIGVLSRSSLRFYTFY